MTARSVVRTAVAVVLLLTVVAVCLLAVLVGPGPAFGVLAAALAGAALLRAFAPAAVLVGARSRAFDVTFLLVLAAALAYLGVWSDATLAAA